MCDQVSAELPVVSVLQSDRTSERSYSFQNRRLFQSVSAYDADFPRASAIFAEKLFIDDELVARGGLGYRLELRGTIKTGEGKGDQILSVSKASLLKFRCRIIAEPGSQA